MTVHIDAWLDCVCRPSMTVTEGSDGDRAFIYGCTCSTSKGE